MTEQEAREKAEAWANGTEIPLSCYNDLTGDPTHIEKHVERLMYEAYLQCYKDMTSGEPDAWALQETDENSSVKWINMDMQFQREDLFFNQEDHPNWRIVPVKLLKLKVGE